MHQQPLILESSCFRVGGYIYRLMKYGLSCQLSTDCQVWYVTWSTINCGHKSIQNLTPLHFRSAQCQLAELWDFDKSDRSHDNEGPTPTTTAWPGSDQPNNKATRPATSTTAQPPQQPLPQHPRPLPDHLQTQNQCNSNPTHDKAPLTPPSGYQPQRQPQWRKPKKP